MTTASESAKERLTIPELWRLLNLPGNPGRSCRSPFREDRNPSFSVYDGAVEVLIMPATMSKIVNAHAGQREARRTRRFRRDEEIRKACSNAFGETAAQSLLFFSIGLANKSLPDGRKIPRSLRRVTGGR